MPGVPAPPTVIEVDYPALHGPGTTVHAVVVVEWERDEVFGAGTVWRATFDRPPFRLDGEDDGFLSLDAVVAVATHRHEQNLTDR